MGKKVDLNRKPNNSSASRKKHSKTSQKPKTQTEEKPVNSEQEEKEKKQNNPENESLGQKLDNLSQEGMKLAARKYLSAYIPQAILNSKFMDKILDKAILKYRKKQKKKQKLALAIIIAAAITGITLVGLLIAYILTILNNGAETMGAGQGGYDKYDGACKLVMHDGYLMDIDEYAARVIATEVRGAPDETLKVLSIAARSFLMQIDYEAPKVGDDPDDCYYDASELDKKGLQSYTEGNIEDRYINAANATKGLIVTLDGEPNAPYDASCVYTSAQANMISAGSTYSDEYYYIRYGETTIGGVNFLGIPKTQTSFGTFETYLQKVLDTNKACAENHGWGISQNGSMYLETYENKNWKEIIDYFYNGEEEIMSIYDGYGYSGEHPINPADEIYSNLRILRDESLADFLSEKGSSIEAFNNHLKSSIEEAGAGTRSGVITAAIELIGNLADMGIKLNYQWGGKYYSLGVNPNWGTTASTDCYGSYANAGYDPQKCLNNYKWSSFDCSGFVNWAIENGMQRTDVPIQRTIKDGITLNQNSAVCEPGDVLVNNGHIVLVVGTDDDRRQYVVAESAGSDIMFGSGGVKLSYYNYGNTSYSCRKLNDIYGD